ncbi:MAG: hypothetical protein CL885_04115 [Dehalococcoidia bacterium]|nr:hypothetical protein [Dehalococcoidia bacterium]
MKFLNRFTSKVLFYGMSILAVVILLTLFAQALALAFYAAALILVLGIAAYFYCRDTNDSNPSDCSKSV